MIDRIVFGPCAGKSQALIDLRTQVSRLAEGDGLRFPGFEELCEEIPKIDWEPRQWAFFNFGRWPGGFYHNSFGVLVSPATKSGIFHFGLILDGDAVIENYFCTELKTSGFWNALGEEVHLNLRVRVFHAAYHRIEVLQDFMDNRLRRAFKRVFHIANPLILDAGVAEQSPNQPRCGNILGMYSLDKHSFTQRYTRRRQLDNKEMESWADNYVPYGRIIPRGFYVAPTYLWDVLTTFGGNRSHVPIHWRTKTMKATGQR